VFNIYFFEMKKLSLILYVVLSLAVIGLYILHFHTPKKSEKSGAVSQSPAQGIAYINIDTVVFKFTMFHDKREDLMTKQKNAEAELNSKGSQYEKGVKDYQEKASKGLITRATAAQMEQALTQQQQELVGLRDKLQSNLMEEEQVMNRQIIEYITKYLEEHKSEYNFQYIFGKSFGSVVLYGDSGLDITQRVIDDINKKYKAEK
jgi:outer membrane protein